ncbi:MAG TPA: cytochrome D1 domain-containing protein, partial [Edaphobacter sp.]|nr:cytochrome D1 domain-containing protein [Edaphobacter sp.]
MRKHQLSAFFVSALCLANISGAQSLLVVNQGDTSVSIVDPLSAKQVAVIAERTPTMHGHEIIASPDGRFAFLPIYGNAGVGNPGLDGREMLILDLPARAIVGRIDFGHGVRPHQPVFDPVRNLLYVTTELDQTVTVIDPTTRRIVGAVPTGQPQSHMLVLSHDGRRGYTANVGPGTVSVLDLVAKKTIAVIPISKETQRISISNDDRWVFTSDQTRPQLAVIDTTSNTVRSWIPLPGAGYGTAPTPDGRFLLVAVPPTNQISVVDLAGMQVVRNIDVPSSPQEILVRPDGKVAYVSCNTSGQVAAIDLSQWKVQSLITAGKFADGL